MYSHSANKGHICTWGFHGSKLFLVAIRHIISRLYTCSMHSTTCICLVYAISWWAVAPSTFFPSTWMNVGMIVNGDSFFWRVGNTCLSICKDQYIRVFTSAWFYATLKFWTGIIYPWRYYIKCYLETCCSRRQLRLLRLARSPHQTQVRHGNHLPLGSPSLNPAQLHQHPALATSG